MQCDLCVLIKRVLLTLSTRDTAIAGQIYMLRVQRVKGSNTSTIHFVDYVQG